MCKPVDGFTNNPTYLVVDWIAGHPDRVAEARRIVTDAVNDPAFADARTDQPGIDLAVEGLRQWIDDQWHIESEGPRYMVGREHMLTDMLTWALHLVDWRQIARLYVHKKPAVVLADLIAQHIDEEPFIFNVYAPPDSMHMVTVSIDASWAHGQTTAYILVIDEVYKDRHSQEWSDEDHGRYEFYTLHDLIEFVRLQRWYNGFIQIQSD